jgi:exosortase/archaeosortase family protein
MKIMRIERPEAFVLGIIAAFLVPLAIPRVGIDFTYFFIMVLVLGAWFTLKWTTVKSLSTRGGLIEIILASSAIAVVYSYKILTQTRLGLLDMLIIFSALVVGFYGFKSVKLFWVPASYGIVLIAGYQLEAVTPNFVVLQNWMAGLMGSAMGLLGVGAAVSGQYVTLNSPSGPLLLDVEGACTGVQGIMAFGLLSTMSVLDIKARPSRLVAVFAVGFIGAFLINIVRLFGVFLAFEYLGVDAGTQVHVYFGYTLFIVWVLVFWSLAFKYLMPRQSPAIASIGPPAPPIRAN